MVRIRLKRTGAKNTPAFRIVITDGRSPRDGRFIEELGHYVPSRRDQNFHLDIARADYWLSKGAQPSETVSTLIRRAKRAAAAVTA